MPSLFLLNATWDKTPSLADPLKREQAAGNAVVLPLDFWAGRRLREASIPYDTPRDYFDASAGPDLDVLAADLARRWYRTLGDDLQHNGIPLGQMAEYDFTFLFIDALRSVEIAHRVFDERAPGQIFLFRQASSRPPSTVAHESLPRVMEYLARQRGVPVTWSEAATPSRQPRERGDTPQMVLRGLSSARTFLHSLRRAEIPVLFMRVGSHARIAAALDQMGLSSLSVPRVRRAPDRRRGRVPAHRTLWEDLRENQKFRETLVYRGVPLAEVLEDRFKWFFSSAVPELIEHIEGAEWLIRRLRPRILVIGGDVSPASRAVTRAFRRSGLPVLVMQHGAVSVDMGGFHVMPLEGDHQAVWGELPRKWHINRGKPPDSQVITGNPGFDPIAGGRDSPPNEVRRRLGLDPQAGIILVATEWLSGVSSVVTTEDEEKFIRHTLRALRQFPHHQVVVKLHPSYQAAYRRIVLAVASEEGIEVMIAEGDLWDLLALSDVVVISTSTVGLEAMILGRPVVVVHTYEGAEEVPYVASGAALGASRPEEIAAAVEKALHNAGVREAMARAREAFVPAYAYKQDGLASERVAQLIRRTIQESRHEVRPSRDAPGPS